MKRFVTIVPLSLFFVYSSCSNRQISSNGEAIYRTGRNMNGQSLLDRSKSRITIIKSCQGCHGMKGDRIGYCNVSWSHLSDSAKHLIPYNDSLFFRFLDKDLKSDGSTARTGVHWNIRDSDKLELIQFLKSL
jgi:hypothetical protein